MSSRTDPEDVHRRVSALRVLAAAGITLVAAAIELAGSWAGRSLFLVADAVHLLAHLAIFAVLLVPRSTWHDRGEDIAAGGVLLLVSGIAVAVTVSSVRALAQGADYDPRPGAMLLSLAGLAANVASAYCFLAPARRWWSFRAALAHELSDGALTVAGLVGAALIAWRGWTWIDGTLSLVIGLWLQGWAIRLLVRRVRTGPAAWSREACDG